MIKPAWDNRTVARSAVIVGAGISGLATAHYLRKAGIDATVLEASDRTGGKVRTVEVAGLPVDTGPDAFLARGGELQALVAELGLEVVQPAAGPYIWSRGQLHKIPPGGAFGLPDRIRPMLQSRLLSTSGVLRAGMDIVRPRTPHDDDPSVADLVRPRFGTEIYERMVEPLLGGVHAGDPARLSARSTVPDIYALATNNRSIFLALRKRRANAPKPTGAPLVSIRGGLSRLTDALGPVTHDEVLSIQPGWRANDAQAEHLVLATPAYVSADLLRPIAADLADELEQIPYVGVANATLAFEREDVPDLPPGNGFLVPPVEGELIVGCTWLTQKWPHLANAEIVLIKCMVGRSGDARWESMSDEQILMAVREALARMLGIEANPQTTLVQRWPRAMPQYVVGHDARLERIDQLVAELPGLHLTGAAYRGAGLAACVGQAAALSAAITEGVA